MTALEEAGALEAVGPARLSPEAAARISAEMFRQWCFQGPPSTPPLHWPDVA